MPADFSPAIPAKTLRYAAQLSPAALPGVDMERIPIERKAVRKIPADLAVGIVRSKADTIICNIVEIQIPEHKIGQRAAVVVADDQIDATAEHRPVEHHLLPWMDWK